MQIVLLGEIGSGKTSLYNRITNSQEKAGYGGQSITINVYSKEAAFGRIAFRVLDTPGFGSYDKKIKHAAGIIAALVEGPVNRILLVVKLDRIEKMRKSVLPVLAPINRYRPLITLTITHWDLSQNQDRDQQLIEQTFQKLNINSFIYTCNNEVPATTCEKIIKEILLSQPVEIQILSSELGTQFDLIEFQDEFEFQVELSKGELAQMFHKKAFALKQFIKQYQLPGTNAQKFEMLHEKSLLALNYQYFSKQIPTVSKSEFDFCEILHQITLESRRIAKKCLQEFEQQNLHLMDDMIEKNGVHSGFLLHALLKKELQADLDEIQLMAQQKLQLIKGHCFNYIKKCNYCGQIWMKVEGCEGRTFCGAVPKKDQVIKSYNKTQNWKVVWESENKFKLVKADQNSKCNQNMNQFQQQQIRKIIKLEDTNEQFEIGEKGCGKLIEWNKMQPLTEGELRELNDPGMLDFLCDQDKEITAMIQNSYKPFQEQIQKAVSEQKKQIQKT